MKETEYIELRNLERVETICAIMKNLHPTSPEEVEIVKDIYAKFIKWKGKLYSKVKVETK